MDLLSRSAIVLTLLALALPPAGGESEPASPDELVIRWLNVTTGSYVKGASPPPDQGRANLIKLDTIVTELIEVNAVKQLMSLEFWIIMTWTDRRLAWDKSGNKALTDIDEIFLPMEWIWQPDFTVRSPIDIRSLGMNKLAQVYANGTVMLLLPYGTTTKCDLSLKDFPFDSQQCNVYLISLLRYVRHQRIHVPPRPMDQHVLPYAPNNEFCVRKVNVSVENKAGDHEQLVITVGFQRRPLYYVTVLIIPSALILVTCLFGFLLPADTGDRLALNVAILLSMSVFLQLAGSITPAQSESVPVLTWYFTLALAITAVITIGSIVTHLCNSKAAKCETVSCRLLRVMFLNRLCCWKERVGGSNDQPTSRSYSGMAGAKPDGGSRNLNETDKPGQEWIHIGSVVDRLAMICSVGSSLAVALFLCGVAVGTAAGGC